MQQTTLLDGDSLTLQAIDNIIRDNHRIDLTPEAWKQVSRSRQAITDMITDPNQAVYGITTGFGSFANVSISPELRRKLQINLIRSHSVGVGQPIPYDDVKRMFILRINTLAKGRSGIRPQTLSLMIQALNKNYLPYVPCQGTVGASGDLAPLSHLALGLLGEGKAYDFKSKSYLPASEVMSTLEVQKITLQQKEGLALINGTQFMTAILSDVSNKAKRLFQSSIVLYAFATQIFGVDKQLFTKSTQQFYSDYSPELAQIIQQVKNLIGQNQSQLHKARVQHKEVHSLLDCPQSMASVLKTIRFTTRLLEEQMNSATDNPLVYFKQQGFENDELISAGNFHGEYVSKSADLLSFGLFQIGKFSQARIQRYVNGKISRLPPFLIKNGGLNSGFMITQYTTAALLSQSKILVQPASVDSIVTSAGQQDHVSMGGFATRKCKMLLHNMSNILGIELLICTNALNILQLKSSDRLMKIYNYIRTRIQPLQEDRFFGNDIQQGARLVLSNLKMI